MVVRAGIEPATTCLEGRCSIRLSYRTVNGFIVYNITSVRAFFKVRPTFRRRRDADFRCPCRFFRSIGFGGAIRPAV